MTFTPHKVTSLPSLSDIQQGAEVYLKAPYAKEITPVERAAYNEFMELIDFAVDCEWHLYIFAFLALGRYTEAYDYFMAGVEMNQPEPDAFGDAADRGNDARGM